jgi:hypothetical protein
MLKARFVAAGIRSDSVVDEMVALLDSWLTYETEAGAMERI